MQPRSQASVRAMQSVFAITINSRKCKMNHAGPVHESLNTVSNNAKYAIFHRTVAASVVHPVISVVWKLGKGSLFPIPLQNYMCIWIVAHFTVLNHQRYV